MNRRVSMTAIAVLWFACWAPAFASGQPAHEASSPSAATHDGEGGHGPHYELMTIDVASAIWTIVVFVIVLIVLRAFAFKPIQQALAAREKFITDSLAQAKRDRDEAEVRLKEYTAKLDKAREDATAIVEEGRRDAEVVKRSIEEDARKQSDAMVARAKREIDIARDAAVRDLYDLGGKLATDVAGKIIRKELSPADHERLIRESIAELGQAGASKN